MRHKKHSHQLGVKTAHRTALMANLCTSLITHKRIRTTLAKAKALRPYTERVITLAKKAKASATTEERLHFYRQALSKVRDAKAVTLLFEDRVDEFLNREGGYIRIYKIGNRIGDAAPMALVEMIDADDEGYPKRRKSKRSGNATDADSAADGADATEDEQPVASSDLGSDSEAGAATEEGSEVSAEPKKGA